MTHEKRRDHGRHADTGSSALGRVAWRTEGWVPAPWLRRCEQSTMTRVGRVRRAALLLPEPAAPHARRTRFTGLRSRGVHDQSPCRLGALPSWSTTRGGCGSSCALSIAPVLSVVEARRVCAGTANRMTPFSECRFPMPRTSSSTCPTAEGRSSFLRRFLALRVENENRRGVPTADRRLPIVSC